MGKRLTALMIALLLALSAGSALAGAMDATNTNPPKVGWKKPSASKAEYATNAGKADLATSATSAEKAKELDANATIFPSCGANQVLTVSGGVFSCVDMASGSSSVGECSASVTLVGGKTYADCCNAGGTVAQIGGGQAICKFSGSSCQSGWIAYENWTTTVAGAASASNQTTFGGATVSGVCSVSTHAFSNAPVASGSVCGYGCWADWCSEGGSGSYCGTICGSCSATVTERGCV